MLFGLIAPSGGCVEILGQDMAAHRARVLPRVGALIETPALYLYMSGRDNLKAVASVLGGVPAKRIDTVLEIVGLTQRQKDRVRTYSLGMKQRLGVALALLHDPDILILDEPANGLDPVGIVEMRDLMHRLADEGKTVFISSHLLSEVQHICHRVAIINHGQLITETAVEDLISSKGEYVVKMENGQEALKLIQSWPWGQNARMESENTLITSAPNGRGRDLNLFLVNAGFAPDSFTPAIQDLEHVFLELTHAGEGQ
jgi:ABC-2 type transport system ATP-binding protein